MNRKKHPKQITKKNIWDHNRTCNILRLNRNLPLHHKATTLGQLCEWNAHDDAWYYLLLLRCVNLGWMSLFNNSIKWFKNQYSDNFTNIEAQIMTIILQANIRLQFFFKHL